MKICVAQTKPVSGNIEANILDHQRFIQLAISKGADAIFFPELSITGYEPEKAKELSTNKEDTRLAIFQQLSDEYKIIIGIGVPLKAGDRVQINMLIFQPDKPTQVYSKQYLHADELPYFAPGHEQLLLQIHDEKIAPAICYEVLVPAHAVAAHENGANIYIASVAKSEAGMEKAERSLSDMAAKYSMTVLLSNSVGPCDNFLSAGKSSVWNNEGKLVAQLTNTSEGILLLDTQTGQIIEEMV